MIEVAIQAVTLHVGEETRELLRNVSFELTKKKIYTIVGKNGEGKTTLLKSITNLLDPNIYSIQGSVLFEEQHLFDLSKEAMAELRKSKIQYVFQDSVTAFDPLKKFDYYFTLFPFHKNEIEKEFERFNLPQPELIFSLHPYEVSGGMAQRIALILALLKKPSFLLLDEPTSAIDFETIALIKKRVKSFVLENNAAVLTITQDLQFARETTDLIAFLENKTLSQFMPYEEFVTSNNPALMNFLSASSRLADATAH